MLREHRRGRKSIVSAEFARFVAGSNAQMQHAYFFRVEDP